MKRFTALIVLVVSLVSVQVDALEADQYQIWKNLSLPDSTDVVNQYLNEELQTFLSTDINKRYHSLSCFDVAQKFMFYIRPHFFLDRLKRDLIQEGDATFYPESHNIFEAYHHSIYRGPVWPFIMPVAQTIRINNVFTGTDKIDHFFSSGRKYFRVYRRYLKKGLSSNEAEMKAIEYGNGELQEKGILGYWSSAAFSYADLESNYQGMRMGIDLCDAKQPVLEHDTATTWRVARPINIRHYVNPLWDEAFNNSYFLSFRKHGAEKVIKNEYCEMADDASVQALWREYQKRLKPSLHTDYLRGLMKVGAVPNPESQSLQSLCGFPKGKMDRPWVWGLPAHF